MLPQYANDKDKQGSRRQRLVGIIRTFLRTIVSNRATRNVFFFLLLNLSFASVEITYGIWTNSLGLIGDGIHMLFDSSALIGSLIASVISTWPQNDRFTYGYGRVETMTGFVNTLLLVYASLSIMWEAVERVFEPPPVSTENLLAVSVAGFVVNLIGIFAFEHGGHGHSHGGGGGGGHGHSHGGGSGNHGHSHAGNGHHHGDEECETEEENVHKNPLLQGMFLHILADTLGSVGVIISSLMLQFFDWQYADPICSLFIATMIFLSVLPLLKSSLFVLLQRSPESLDNVLRPCYQKLIRIEGVEGYSDQHFWEHSSKLTVGTIRVQAAPAADEQKIRLQVTTLFRKAGVNHFTVEVVKTSQTF